MKRTPETKLRRASGVRVEIGTGGEARVSAGGAVVRAGTHALAVLDAFAEAASLQEVLAKLASRVRSAEDSIDLTRTILQLADAGVLVSEDEGDVAKIDAAGFDAPAAHVMMLDDRARTACFLEAIAKVVRAGDVVVDLGTGTGVLAVAAARAGAKRVYAIEARGVASVAREVFVANGVADRVTLIEGWSTRVTLPERADVLVGEILGDDAWSERVIESFRDARERHLVPGARVVPESVRLFASLVSVPDELRRRRAPTPEALADWRQWYGIDLAPLAAASARVAQPFYEDPRACAAWPAIAAPVDLGAIDLRAAASPDIERTSRVTVARAGRVDAVLVYPEVLVAPGHVLSLAPSRATPANHWRAPLWLLGAPIDVSAGDALDVRYRAGGAVEVSRASASA